MSKAMVILVVVVLLLGSAGLVYAADEAAPGDLLYTVDRAIETARLGLMSDTLGTVELQMAFARERLEEALELIDAGETGHYHQALDEYDQAIFEVVELVGGAEDVDHLALDGLLESEFAAQEPLLELMPSAADDDDDDADRDWCTSKGQHPLGLRIAERYDVEYKVILDWFCQEIGWGQISMAYGLSERAGVDPSELFAMRADKAGWGQIKRIYNLPGKPPDVPRGNAKGHNE
jgi:hypothetical protein